MIPESIRANPPVATPEGGSQSAGALGQEDFLRMLIAQLENQDPLNPQDSTEFTAQLAQFSSLEQMIAMREGIEALAASPSEDAGLDGVPLVGKSVLHETDSFTVGEEGALPGLFVELTAPESLSQIDILDSNGNLVRSLNPTTQFQAGVTQLDLTGIEELPPGVYSFHASRGEQGSANTLVLDRVTGSSIGDADPTLFFGDATSSLSRVREVRP